MFSEGPHQQFVDPSSIKFHLLKLALTLLLFRNSLPYNTFARKSVEVFSSWELLLLTLSICLQTTPDKLLRDSRSCSTFFLTFCATFSPPKTLFICISEPLVEKAICSVKTHYFCLIVVDHFTCNLGALSVFLACLDLFSSAPKRGIKLCAL